MPLICKQGHIALVVHFAAFLRLIELMIQEAGLHFETLSERMPKSRYVIVGLPSNAGQKITAEVT